MAGNTIEAKLRIATEVAQAIANLRAYRREVLGLRDDTKAAAKEASAPGSSPTGQQDAGAAAARQASARAERDAARESTRAQRQADAEARQLRRQAAAEEAEALKVKRQAERKANAEKVREEQDVARKVRAAANIQTNATRQLPAQVTDIVTGLASVQNPLTVLIQQGGQLRDSFQGSGNAFRALLALFTPARVLIGGVAAALAAVAGGAIAGALEVDRLNKAFALTGNTAGVSIGQVGGIAQRIAGDMKASIGDVRDTLAELIEAGTETGASLESSARAVTAYRKLTGASAAEAVKIFAGQRDSILDWATKANRAYNFLTAEQLNYIRTLQAQGRADEAARFANEELAKTLQSRSVPAVGALERAWNSVKAAVSGVIDTVKGFGRPETIDDQVAALTKRIAALAAARDASLKSTRRGAAPRGAISNDEIERLQAELEALNKLRAADQVRAAERSAQQKVEQDKAFEQSKTFTDAKAAVVLAGYQKELAATLKQLQERQSAVDLAAERELEAEQRRTIALGAAGEERLAGEAERVRREIELRRSRELNLIEQDRIQAQILASSKRLGTEEGRTADSPLDIKAREAAVTQVQAELIGLQSQLQAAVAAGQKLLADAATQNATDAVKAWDAATQRIRELAVQNAAAAVATVTDPQARASAAAAAATAEARRRLESDQGPLVLAITAEVDPKQRAALQRQLQELTAQSTAVINDQARQARFASLRQQFDELADSLRASEQEIAAQVDASTITTEEGERRKRAARAESVPQLERILELLRALAKEGTQAEQNQVKAVDATVGALKRTVSELGQVAKSSAISELAGFLTDVQTGAKSAGDALRDMVSGFARAMLQVLNQRLAQKLVDDMISTVQKAASEFQNSGGAGGSSEGSAWGAFANFLVGLMHTGGVIGSSLGSGARAISPLAFAGAQVLHGGGLVGLASNERPIIAKVGEEMLTEDNPRHIKNWRGGAGGVTVNASYTFQGGGGTEQDQRAAAQDLDRRMRATVETWAAEQSRQGGMFNRG